MRELRRAEMNKRGCLYCADFKPVRGKPKSLCKHDECPYHELDPYKSYYEYLKAPQQNALKVALEKIMNPERRIG